MVLLIGNNLGKRQQELNIKVNDAALSRVNFDDVKAENEDSDVDKLFKIDLASKYKNIEYIIEIFKSGDSLHISRALKCLWLYHDESAHIINADYLNRSIFPHMSIKMKKKLLSTVSTYVRNEKRAEDFFTYCINIQMANIAIKFLIFTTESFKMDVIKENSKTFELIQDKDGGYLRHFIGNSFSLADMYLKIAVPSTRFIYELSYLYSVSDVKYLGLIENYKYGWDCYESLCLGRKISRDILKKHKSRIYENPLLYLKIIKKSALVKHSTNDDLKFYAAALLPKENFWKSNYYETNKHILDRIPMAERLSFIRKIFTVNYPGQEFEMKLEFYTFKYYDLMTIEEREAWALRHIASEAELLGNGEDYIWYKFVNFERAFLDIKKYILISKNSDKRLNFHKILIESARNLREIEKLLKYYYKRHINEQEYNKMSFVDSIMQHHNVYEFDDDCWTAFDKLLHSLKVYDKQNRVYYGRNYRNVALIHYIVNKKDVPDILYQFIIMNAIDYGSLKNESDILSVEKKEMVFQYMLQFFENKIKSFDRELNSGDVKNSVKQHVHSALELLRKFDKTKVDIPKIIEKYINLDWDEFKSDFLFREYIEPLTQHDLMRFLKQDATLIVDKLPLIKKNIETNYLKLNQLLRKLKIYFSDNIAKDYLGYFKDLLLAPELMHHVADAAVYGIFQLADDQFKIDFMAKHVPQNTKIDHANICRNELLIQEAICAYACHSRPPVPLKTLLMYVKGDYVQFCLPMFNCFLANLPLPLCIKFVESIIDNPLSIQKHGLRLAFECFSVEYLKEFTLNIWKKTKNVSLRKIMYVALVNKVLEEKGHDQKELFEVLKVLTLDLHQDDDDDLYYLLICNRLPDNLKGEFLVCAWDAVNKLPVKRVNTQRKTTILNCIEHDIHLFPKDILQSFVDEHIGNMLNKKQILIDTNSDIDILNRAKWELVAKSIVYTTEKKQLEKNLKLLKSIIKKCLERWCEVHNSTYVFRKICLRFIYDLKEKNILNFVECHSYVNIIFKTIHEDLDNALPKQEIYMLIWELRLHILTTNVAISGKQKLSGEDTHDKKVLIVKETTVNFAKELTCLINEFIERQEFYTSFYPEIVNEVTKNVQSLMCYINNYNLKNLSYDDMHVLISSILIETEIPQTYIIALKLLPSVYNGIYSDMYTDNLKKIKAYKNNEVQCKLHQKFFNSFTWRSFMES